MKLKSSFKLNTGYDLGCLSLVGFVDSAGERYYAYSTDLDPSIQCQSCSFCLTPWKCNEFELKRTCKADHYVYSKVKVKKTKERYPIVDLKDIANKCMDYCLYYEPDCYNKNKSTCILRLIEENTSNKP